MPVPENFCVSEPMGGQPGKARSSGARIKSATRFIVESLLSDHAGDKIKNEITNDEATNDESNSNDECSMTKQDSSRRANLFLFGYWSFVVLSFVIYLS